MGIFFRDDDEEEEEYTGHKLKQGTKFKLIKESNDN